MNPEDDNKPDAEVKALEKALDEKINELESLLSSKETEIEEQEHALPVLDELVDYETESVLSKSRTATVPVDNEATIPEFKNMALEDFHIPEVMPEPAAEETQHLELILQQMENRISSELDNLMDDLKTTLKENLMSELKSTLESKSGNSPNIQKNDPKSES